MKAMQEELNLLKKNKNYELVDLPKGRKVLKINEFSSGRNMVTNQ